MAHHTQYIVLFNDGNAQHYVGFPQRTRIAALSEIARLAVEEDYDVADLSIVEAPA